ncbi:MAG: hypothetical protein LUI13_13865 [Lachnospiraceae bacterium]|nr:hypothetical protein [Lachnospiraceae bacterium]
MEGEELDAIYELTSALADIYYDELTEEEQVQVSNIDALWEILDYFSGAVMATAFAYDSDGFYTSGDTTYYQPATLSNGVYQISNAGQLFWLASLVNGDTTQEDITEAVSGANAKLTANINLQNKTWVPIGSYSGTFDGNGKTISGLYINSTSGYQGFFSTVSGGTVKSLTLSGNGITGAGSTGSIAGALTNGGTIESCTNNVPVTGSGYYVGGIVGYVAKGNITSCTNNAALSNTSADLGGIAGFIESGCTVSSCTNTGTVSGSSSYFGGIVGNSGTSSAGGNTISNCINSGAVSCNNNVGGILGYMMNTTAVSGCVNSGAVSATGGWVGGVVGNMTTASSSSVSSCSNSGTVTGGGDYTGGVVAYAAGSITGCSNSGAVTGSGDYTGGIIGSGAIAVSQCANTGTVSGPRRVGGIIGRLSSGGTVRNCYNAGAVSCTNQYAGGIVGESYGTIYVSHNYGKITGTSVGAIIGYVNSSGAISSAWYLSDTGNSVYGTGKTVGANARTTGQFASGYVTYSMQNTAGSSQIWGQDLTSATPDPYPVLTSDSSKKVLQVTIILVDGSSQTTLETSYTNYGKTLLSYPTLTGDDTYEFYSDSACTQSWDT